MEKDDELKGQGNSYDFGARMYDSRLGRWFAVDPLAGKYAYLSPYNYVGNSPVVFVDYDGEDFGIKFDHGNKTIVIVSNLHATSKRAYNQALKAVKKWNEKTAEISDYTVSFQIKVLDPIEPTLDEVAQYSTGKIFRKNGKLHKRKYQFYKNRLSAAMATGRGSRDPIGNTFTGNTGQLNKDVSGSSFTAGVTADKTLITMNDHDEKGDLSNYEDVVSHELGHTFGLDDEGGEYFVEGGIMEYEFDASLRMQDITDAEVSLIVDIAMRQLQSDDKLAHPTVKLLEPEKLQKMEIRTRDNISSP